MCPTSLNLLLMNLLTRADFPTLQSPTRTTLQSCLGSDKRWRTLPIIDWLYGHFFFRAIVYFCCGEWFQNKRSSRHKSRNNTESQRGLMRTVSLCLYKVAAAAMRLRLFYCGWGQWKRHMGPARCASRTHLVSFFLHNSKTLFNQHLPPPCSTNP